MNLAWLAALILFASTERATALERTVLEDLASSYETRIFELRVNLHEPNARGRSMQAPTLNADGWYHHNPSGPVSLRAGSRVEVTGVFNYSERGFFLELAAERTDGGLGPDNGRPRIRVRFMVESLPAEIEEQTEQALELLEKVLRAPAIP